MTKEDLKQCNAKWKELHQIETLVQTLRADARSTKAVCYNHEPKSKGEATAAVHRHVIAVIRGPAQSKFREIARTNHHSPCLVGNIH